MYFRGCLKEGEKMSVIDLQGEIWKDIVIDSEVYPYQISSFGRIKSLSYNKTGRERLLKQSKTTKGYLFVKLCGRRKKQFLVHRLVATVFLENPLNLPCVNHIDENKSNNTVENLEFCSYQYNNTYKNLSKKKEKKRLETLKTSTVWKEGNLRKSKQVYQYTTDLKLVNIFPSLAKIFQELGYKKSAISACCLGKQKTAYNFIWSYEPIETSSNQLTLFPITEKKIS